MPSFLTLIRFPNLLIIAFTQWMMRYAIIQPVVRMYGFELQMSGFTFFCLVLSTICTAAAGYAINDYFDVKADYINRPDDVVVGKTISRRKAMLAHIVLCVSGILLGGYVTWSAGVAKFVLIYLFVAGMLWLYSFIYKRQFLIGNIIVAFFTALVPLMPLLDIPPVYSAYHQDFAGTGINLNLAVEWILGFAGFAFLTTLSREIIKDAEDFEGDVAYGCRSLPVVLGSTCTKWVIICTNTVITGAVACIFWKYLRYAPTGQFDYFSLIYLSVSLIVPLSWVSRLVYKTVTNNDYRKAGNVMKIIMLAGTAYSGIVWFAWAAS
jgi:4-hydroxybenzoate polyprenyltransferase